MTSGATSTSATTRIAPEVLDALLSAQLIVAWAGESGEERRLGWWKTDLVAEYGGYDLFKRLLPNTWDWAALQAVREAARRRDAELRVRADHPDRNGSLYRLGCEVGEQVDERLLEPKRSGDAPPLALPALDGLVGEHWSEEAFVEWVASHGAVDTETSPLGRRIKGALPGDVAALTSKLVGALAPTSDAYPLPHYRRKG